MKAKEMFEELGYELIVGKNDIPRKSWGAEFNNFKYIYKKEKSVLLFYKNQRKYSTTEYGSGDDDDRIHTINFYLNKAIQKQIEELGWE